MDTRYFLKLNAILYESKSSCRVAIAALLFLLSNDVLAINSQGISPPRQPLQSATDWVSIAPKDEEFTVSLPESPVVYSSWTTYSDLFVSLTTKRKSHAYVAYADGVAYVIMSFKKSGLDNDKSVKAIERIVDGLKNDFANQSRTFTVDIVFEHGVNLNNFDGKQYRISVNGVLGLLRCYAAKDHFYLLEAIGEDGSNSSVQSFFASFRLSNQPTASGEERVTLTNNLHQKNQDTAQVFRASEVDRKALIVMRREPGNTVEAQRARVTGTVVITAVLSASGKVANIEVVRGLPGGLSETAREATSEIKFVPALKEGRRVSQHIQIEYAFTNH